MAPASTGVAPDGSQVQVPLSVFTRAHEQLRAAAAVPQKRLGPAVVLGEARYVGRANAETGALELRASLLDAQP